MTKSQKLSVGLVFDDSLDRPDGVAQYVKTLGAYLSLRGYQVSYLVGQTTLKEWAGGRVYSLSKNKTVNFNGNKLSVPLPGNGSNIKKFMAAHQFDVLHVMVPYSPFMAAQIIKSAPKTTAIIGTFHIFPAGQLSRAGSKLLKLILWPTLRRFDQIVSVSQASANFATTHYDIESQVVPNPVDTKRYKTVRQVADKNQIVFLGRLVKRKGAAELIEAFSVLAKTNSSVKLVIAGDGPQRVLLEKRVNQLKLAHRITFLGYIDEKDKPQLLASSAIACFPSLYGEAFGIVLIEAMAAGNAVVVAGDNPGYRSVLGGQADLLINPKDKYTFAQRLNDLLLDTQKRQEIKAWQSKEVRQYDISVVGNQITDIYQTVIARLSKKSHNKKHE